MELETQKRMLDHLITEWKSRGADRRAWGAWIRLHDPVSGELPVSIKMPLRAVWFLDERGLQPRSTCEFLQFWTVQVEQIWHTGGFTSPKSDRGLGTRPGWAAFAEIEGTDEIYLETVWGGQSCPGGARLAIAADGSVFEKESVWIG